MRILITGAKGQLGKSLAENLIEDEIFLTDLPELDLVSYRATMESMGRIKPDLVIHCAAKTHVDDCELNPDEAYLANVIAAKNVVIACQSLDAVLVYISTDYVFDGTAGRPYREYDLCNPQSIYGKTKWQGEEIVKMHLQKFYIVRTAWLFGDGPNFVQTIIKLAGEKDTLKVVNDQTGSPTYAVDLAEAINQLIRTNAYGIYHITNEGSCSWFEFAEEILRAMKKNTKIEAVATEELKRPAPRPKYSVLGKECLHELGINLPVYTDALRRFLEKKGDFPKSK